MSENKPVRLPKTRRFEVYTELKRQGKTNRVIAEAMGISERMLDRHISEWKENGILDNWILSEWMITKAALGQDQGGIKEVFKALTQWLLKRMKQQTELEVKGTPKIQVEIIDNAKQENTVQASS